MILFLEGVDRKYPTVLHEGPFIPRVWDQYNAKKADKANADEDSSEEERTLATWRYIIKDPSKYKDEDKHLVALDTKVRAIIALSLPDEVYHSLVNFSIAKEMWYTLCVLYEGTSEVKKSRKISLDPNDPSEAYLSEADDEGEETSIAQLLDGVAMLAVPNMHVSSNSDRAEKFKAKYKREKEIKDLLANKGKCLLAESHDWVDEPTSESDKEMANLCFMDKIDDVDDSEAQSSSMALVSVECSTSSTQVELEDLKTINFTLAKEKNKLLKRFKKEQEIVKRWTSSSKNLEKILQDQMSCDDKFGLCFGKSDLDPPSDTHAPFSLPSFYESSKENSDNSQPLESSDLSEHLKFGMFIKAKGIGSPHESEEAQGSNDPPKPILESMISMTINEGSSSEPNPSKISNREPQPSSKKLSSYDKGKSAADLPCKRKFPKKDPKKSSILPIPRSMMLKKSNSKLLFSTPLANSDKGFAVIAMALLESQ
ncbi:hypothetical protein L6452_08879 [Arctium lappa]|uniref:Uncharacterized protein n=1 Tax=Arctium lappa TaxID=4217 RepID=A0ACB9DIU2_ARCLA|nr:hypothetical protein L6452_08879 [Arctium lappa]